MFLAPPHNTCNYFILVTNGVSRPASFVQPMEAHERLDAWTLDAWTLGRQSTGGLRIKPGFAGKQKKALGGCVYALYPRVGVSTLP